MQICLFMKRKVSSKITNIFDNGDLIKVDPKLNPNISPSVTPLGRPTGRNINPGSYIPRVTDSPIDVPSVDRGGIPLHENGLPDWSSILTDLMKGLLTGGGRTSGDVPGNPGSANPLWTLLSDSSYLSQFLGYLMSSGAAGSSDFLNLLLQLGAMNKNKVGTSDDDLQSKLIEMFLTNLQQQEQRGYDEKALQEQRGYDSPTSQLARLMGAGVSRDAAIQMLSQGGESPLVGSGSQVPGVGELPSPSQTTMNALQTASGVLGTIGSLVGLGFSVPQAIQQTHFLKNQNLLSDKQLASYNSAGKAFSILSAAGASAESFGSAGAAIAQITRLANSGNAMAQQFVQSGGIADMQQNAPFVSNVLRDLYGSENGSEMFRKEMNRMDLQNELTRAQTETEYQNVMDALQRMLESDERCKLYREQLITQKAISRQEQYAANYADFQQHSLDKLVTLSDNEGRDIFDLMSASQFNEVWMNFKQAAVRCDDPKKFEEWCQNNWSAVCDLATIQYIANMNYVENLGDSERSTWMSRLLRFNRLMHDSGLGSTIQNAVSAGLKAAELLTPVKKP